MSSIGVWNTAFLGDAILTLPLLQTLRRAYPEAEIHFWVRKGFAPLFSSHPAVSAVFEYDKRGGQSGLFSSRSVGKKIASARHSLWISAHSSFRSAMMARWSSAKLRIGYDRPWCNRWFYTHLVPRRFGQLDEIERLLQLVTPLRLEWVERWPQLHLPADARARAAAFFEGLDAMKPGAPVLGLHPGSVWGTKRWSTLNYAAIARRALEQGAHVLLFAGPGEEDMAREVENRIAQAIAYSPARHLLVNLGGRLSLTELAAYIQRLSCYVTNDSGPMHLAWAQRTPVTAIFGPTVRELGFFPRGGSSTVFELPLECRPCGLHGPQECPLGHHRCMTAITPEMVWPDVAGKLFGTA